MAVSTIDALYHSGSEKLTTSATGITVTGTVAATAVTGDGSGLTGLPAGVGGANGVIFNDNVKAQFGAGNDLQIYHDGSNSYLNNTTGDLTLDGSGDIILDADGTDVRLAKGGVQYGMFTTNSTPLGFYIDALVQDGDLFFRGNDGGSTITAMTIDMSAGGQVGIGGTPNSGRKLHIEGGDTSVGITLKDTAGQQMAILSDGNNLEFKSDSSGNVFCQMYGATGAKSFGSFESFSGGYNLYAGAGSAASYGIRIDGAGTGSAGILQVVNGYGQVGSISVSGASTQFNTSSDYRLKTDVQPMTGASARVQALNPVNFEWIADGNRTDGFLAHEAQEVVPEAITGIKDAMKDEPYEVTPAVLDDDGNVTTEAVMGGRTIPDHQSIDQSKLVPLLTAALQEALTEIASLKTRVEALEA
jgi:hypothetical protein